MTLWSLVTITVPMASKLGRMVTYLGGLVTIKWNSVLITWFCKVTWQTKVIISLLSGCLWPPNLKDGSSPWWTATHKVTWPSDFLILWDHVTNQNHYIQTVTVPMAKQPGRMVTYFERLLTIKSHSPLITWFCKAMWQTRAIVSLLIECLLPPSFIEWESTLGGF